MRAVLACLGLFVVSATSGFAGKTPEEFLAAVRAAVEAKSPAQLLELTYTEGMSEKDKETVLKVNERVFADAEIATVGFEEIPDETEFVHIARGRKIEPTVEPSGMVKVEYVKRKRERQGCLRVV